MGDCFGSDPPDYAAANQAAIQGQAQAMPAYRAIDALASAGKAGTVNIPGQGPTWMDFTGQGYADVASQIQAALVKSAKELNPKTFALSDQVLSAITKEQALGRNASPEQLRYATQDTRQGQAARGGNFFGAAPLAEEVLNNAKYRDTLNQTRLTNAVAALTNNASPMAGIWQTTAAQAGQQAGGMAQTNPNAGLGVYSQMSQNWANDVPDWMLGLSTVTNLGGTASRLKTSGLI